MRVKEYTREDILVAAYQLVDEEGYHRFTARNVARKMGASTQLIYDRFGNLDNLKTEVSDLAKDSVLNEFNRINPAKVPSNTFLNRCICYALFINRHANFHQMFFDKDFNYGSGLLLGLDLVGESPAETCAVATTIGLASQISTQLVDIGEDEIHILIVSAFMI